MEFQSHLELLEFYNSKCVAAENQIEALNKKLDLVLSGSADALAEETEDKHLQDLINKNKKLKYRISLMKRSIEEYQIMTSLNTAKKKDNPASKSTHSAPGDLIKGNNMVNILGYLEAFFTTAVLNAFPSTSNPGIVSIQISKVADYQCNAALSLAKILKSNPREVGQKILNNAGSSPLISKMELSGPGFINITLSKNFINQQVNNLIINGVTPPATSKLKVVVDFSSPNIAKEMHVGHLRSTIIGECISRLLEFLGHDVMRLNHLGDWGTQFGMLIAHIENKFPDYLANVPPISDLQAFYKESKTRFDEDSDFKKRAYDIVVRLQSHEAKYYKAWQDICRVSLKEFDKVYDRLNVSITPRGESFYQNLMEELVKQLDEKNLLSLEDGRKVMYPDTEDIPLTIVKSDGGFTYDTSDMACIKQRVEKEKAEWLIYVTDAGQAQHFKSFTSCAKKAGIWDPSKVRLDHVTFGVVLGEDKKKFKTRSGDTVRLVDLLDEGVERSKEKLCEKERDKALSTEEFKKAQEAVAYGCIKYADLCHDRSRDYVFSFDRMLDFRGNTAAYLLYALTRIRSIARTGGISRETLLEEAKKANVTFDHEKEWKLARILLKLPDVLVKLCQDLYIHPLCEFLYEVSTVFTEFYDNCYCIEKDSSGNITKINMNRLLLCEATAIVMEKCFDILNISTLEKM